MFKDVPKYSLDTSPKHSDIFPKYYKTLSISVTFPVFDISYSL